LRHESNLLNKIKFSSKFSTKRLKNLEERGIWLEILERIVKRLFFEQASKVTDRANKEGD
jgi:hypothetical protein